MSPWSPSRRSSRAGATGTSWWQASQRPGSPRLGPRRWHGCCAAFRCRPSCCTRKSSRPSPSAHRCSGTPEATAVSGAGRRRPRPSGRGLLGTVDSERADVLRLRTLGALSDLELDPLGLLECLVASRLDRRVVHKDVGAAVVLGNEPVALLSVEPLHRTLRHAVPVLLSCTGRHDRALCPVVVPQCLIPRPAPTGL